MLFRSHIGTKIVDIKSTTVSIIRMHEKYIAKGIEFSTTFNLNLATKGMNQMANATYISPKNYRAA